MLFSTLVAFLATGLFGFLWFSPNVFGNQWMKLVGKTADQLMNKERTMAVGLSVTLLMNLAIGVLVKWIGLNNFLESLQFTVVAGLGIAVMTTATNFVWEQRSLNLFLIYAGHILGVVFISALIYTYM